MRKRRSEEHTSELQSPLNLVCRLLLEKKKNPRPTIPRPGHTPPPTQQPPIPPRHPPPSPPRLKHCLLNPHPRNTRTARLFFFNDTATTEIYTLSLHDALPICALKLSTPPPLLITSQFPPPELPTVRDRKSTRLNSSHHSSSYAVFCLKKK